MYSYIINMLNLDDIIKKINSLNSENKNKKIINHELIYPIEKKPDAYKNINSSSIIINKLSSS